MYPLEGWTTIEKSDICRDKFEEAVFSLIGLLNHVIEEKTPIGFGCLIELRDEVFLAMQFNRLLSEPEDRKLICDLLSENHDVMESIRVIRKRNERIKKII